MKHQTTKNQLSFQKVLTQFCVMLLIVFSSYSGVAQTTHNISDPEDLTVLSATLAAGDTVILANGTYSSDARIKFSPTTGTAAMPITFKAETPGGVIFDGGLRMSIGGDHVVVADFHWKNGYGASNFIEFRDGFDYANYSTIQNCVIESLAIHPDDVADDIANNSITKHRWIVLYGTYNTVINCSFMDKQSAGALVLVELAYNAEADRCAVVGHTITNNYFYKYAKMNASLSNSGDSETIRVGTSEYQNVDSSVTVSNNYFVEADGENEIITNKSKNNVYTNNTFRRCRGSLVLRHGSNATVDGNYFLGEDVDGTGGIRITDSNHTVTNNYIQDCITVLDQAKWNNGITFIGGGDSANVVCTSTSVSNGYQKSENINVSNNTIVNTNAPLFYNEDKGSTDPTGTVSNNLIYFAASDPNSSNVISGDSDSANAFANLGTALAYSGNVFTGTNLGATTTGFSEENGITATADGEIFTFTGTGSAGKGADMGAYEPATDAMVGYGIGACFLNNVGGPISNGDCSVVINDYLTVSSLSTLPASASSNDITVNSNVSWTAASNDSWITINTTSATGNATVSVSVTENIDTSTRTGSVTFTQDPGGDDIVRTLNVTQEGAEITSLYTLINTGTATDPVTIDSFSKEEVNGTTKFNYAANTLDKDNGSVWAADDGAVLAGDYKGDGEYIIYSLGDLYNLDFIQFTTTNKSDPFGYQIWVSTTGTETADFTMVLPTTGELLLTATGTTDFNQYEVDAEARYVKLMGYGRFNSAGDTRTSQWNAIGEIEFFGELSSLSVEDNAFQKQINIYPNPVSDIFTIKSEQSNLKALKVYNLDGRLVLEQSYKSSQSEISIDASSFSNGLYLINLSSDSDSQQTKLIVVSH
ncbi:chondroitinase-B domain-containing protein [Algibacter luteus]|uniref:Poly(Beta-D-mannuronate) lyase n=1 Tax=Algibacter luteus TaxID=1178825 RepID=A0A1M6H7V4_9FLAO|nr:chondroitinase-B domain-containing protein [Algibacter luteus]SHJ18277.1 poly(beta-D-mannuronate) lyase [Algibacter luteus]